MKKWNFQSTQAVFVGFCRGFLGDFVVFVGFLGDFPGFLRVTSADSTEDVDADGYLIVGAQGRTEYGEQMSVSPLVAVAGF